MPCSSLRYFASIVCVAFMLCNVQARAEQLVYGSTGNAGMAPSPANNYVSVPGTSPYPNPYQVPAATATSYKPVSVPGSGENSKDYPPVSETQPVAMPAATNSYQPVSVPAAPSYQPAPEIQPVQQPQPIRASGVYPSGNSSYAPGNMGPPTTVSTAAAGTFDPAYRGINETPSAPPSADTYKTVSGPHFGEAKMASVQGMPSYNYDPDLDPKKNPPYRAPTADQNLPDDTKSIHPYLGLETRSGLDLGLQFFYYRYDEPSVNVSEIGEPFGITVKGTVTSQKYFATADVRYMFGDVDYDGSGTINNEGVDSWELRGLFGRDFAINREYSISPYIGVGYRTLFNDNRGVSSTGAIGYRRFNQLYYLPIGVYPRTHIDSNARLAASLEYDFVLHGNQETNLADVNVGDPNVNNGQSSGYGIRGDIMYETRTWGLGPFFTYWHVDQSKTKISIDNSAVSCAGVGGPPCILSTVEPANHTFEAGVAFKYHFF